MGCGYSFGKAFGKTGCSVKLCMRCAYADWCIGVDVDMLRLMMVLQQTGKK